MAAIEPLTRGLRILCLDGGGMKGLFEIEMLKIIEHDINVRLKTNMKVIISLLFIPTNIHF